ncbi:MAG TPA: response regulator transcription factor [Marmoricola sp.]
MTMHAAPPRSRVRILVFEDHALFAESLELALTLEGYDVRRVPVPDHACAAGQVLAPASRWKPRIALVDLDLGKFGDGADLIEPLARSGVNVVVVTASIDHARWGECMQRGARKVISKNQPLNDILAVVRRLSQGLPVISHEEREELVRLWRERRRAQQVARNRLATLTTREREILGQLIEGHPVRDIARHDFVSEATVRTQVKSILAKLGVSSQLAAAGLARSVGWQAPDAKQ